MIRPLTLVTMLAAMAAGMHVYQTKHEVALLDRDLRKVAKAIEEQNERSLALSAEWAWLNEPERLRQSAQRHLTLEPMMPHQFVRFAEFERRLPQAAGFDGPPALFAARDAGAGVVEANGATRLELASRTAAPPVLRVTIAAVVAPAAQVASAPVAAPATALATAPAVSGFAVAAAAAAVPVAAAAVATAARTHATDAAEMPRPLAIEPAAAPRPPPRPVAVTIAAAPRPVVVRPAPAVANLSPIAAPARAAPQDYAAPRLASLPPQAPVGPMLGSNARSSLAPPVAYGSLPPPVPFASANAAAFGGTSVR